MDYQITLGIFEILNIVLVIIFLMFGVFYFSNIWNNSLSKPYAWVAAVNNNEVTKELIRFEKNYYDKIRLYNIWFQINRIKHEKIEGSFAELGVYKGETAKIIHECANDKPLFLFDTYEGFDAKDLEYEVSDDPKYSTENFSDVNIDDIKLLINPNDNVQFIKGYFPDSLRKEHDIKYAFVNLDADLYKPTLAALRYFYPRLSAGGVIIIHDYNHSWDGNRKAIDEFASSIRDTIIEIPDSQGSAMIIKTTQHV